MWKVLVKPGFTTEFQTGLGGWWPGRGRCSRGFPCAGAFLPWQWISWRSMEVSISKWHLQKSWNPNLLISVISLQILSNFINETSGYHQYIIDISWIFRGYLMWVTSMKFTTWCFSSGCWHAMGGLRETFRRAMMVASSRPWFDKAIGTIDPLMAQTAQHEAEWNKETTCLTDQLSPNWYFGRSSPNFDHF